MLRSVLRLRFSKSGWRSRLIHTVGGAKNDVIFSRSIISRTTSGTGLSIRCVTADQHLRHGEGVHLRGVIERQRGQRHVGAREFHLDGAGDDIRRHRRDAS